ncbi:hypothetical protein QFZ67_000265 [Streptomyces sp. V1I1]|nr:hypothetical protein [Streptomyces sp. V1I1]
MSGNCPSARTPTGVRRCGGLSTNSAGSAAPLARFGDETQSEYLHWPAKTLLTALSGAFG